MTFDQYNETQLQLERDAAEIQLAIKNLRLEFIRFAPFQPGQKVRVTGEVRGKAETAECFIKAVHPHYKPGKFGGYKYDFVKMKADGTPSQVNQHFYGNLLGIEIVAE